MKAEGCEIRTPFIKLDSLLKLSGLVSTGGEGKILIQDGKIRVNGEICLQRGRKLRPGDKVEYNGREVEVTGGT